MRRNFKEIVNNSRPTARPSDREKYENFQFNINTKFIKRDEQTQAVIIEYVQAPRPLMLYGILFSSLTQSSRQGCDSLNNPVSFIVEKDPRDPGLLPQSRDWHLTDPTGTTGDTRQKMEKSFERYVSLTCSTEELEGAKRFFVSLDWEKVDEKEFIWYCNGNKISSLGLQEFLIEFQPSRIVVDLAIKTLRTLIANKFGCYVVRRLIMLSPVYREYATTASLKYFIEFSSNEYSSRVMQLIAENDVHYCESCIKAFCARWRPCIVNSSAIYLMAACFRNGDSSSDGFRIIRDILQSRCSRIDEYKYDKRLLLSFVEFCSDNDADLIFKQIKYDDLFSQKCQDKYMVYTFKAFLKRGHSDSFRVLYYQVNHHLLNLLTTRYFKVLLHDLFTEKKTYEVVQFNIIEILLLKLLDSSDMPLDKRSKFIKRIYKARRFKLYNGREELRIVSNQICSLLSKVVIQQEANDLEIKKVQEEESGEKGYTSSSRLPTNQACPKMIIHENLINKSDQRTSLTASQESYLRLLADMTSGRGVS